MARYANPYHPPCFPQPDFHPQKTHSPSQGRLSASRKVGRLRVPMNGTMLDVARIRLTFCSPLGCTAREADSLPYSGMAICFTAGIIPKSGYRFYKLVVKLDFGEANDYPANVGEDIILPPRWSTACSDEWYFVGHGMERSDLGSPKGSHSPKPPSGREVSPVRALVTEGENPGSLKRSGQKVQRNRGWRLWVEALAVDQRSLPQSASLTAPSQREPLPEAWQREPLL